MRFEISDLRSGSCGGEFKWEADARGKLRILSYELRKRDLAG